MFCNKCGNEISDEAIACPNCGCSTKNTEGATSVQSKPNIELINYGSQVGTVFMYSVLALILSLGIIGIIFEIMFSYHVKRLPQTVNLVTDYDSIEFRRIEDKLRLATTLYVIASILSTISIIVGFVLLIGTL